MDHSSPAPYYQRSTSVTADRDEERNVNESCPSPVGPALKVGGAVPTSARRLASAWSKPRERAVSLSREKIRLNVGGTVKYEVRAGLTVSRNNRTFNFFF